MSVLAEIEMALEAAAGWERPVASIEVDEDTLDRILAHLALEAGLARATMKDQRIATICGVPIEVVERPGWRVVSALLANPS